MQIGEVAERTGLSLHGRLLRLVDSTPAVVEGVAR